MLQYKGELAGLNIITIGEAYTSKSSFLDNDPIPNYGDKKPKFSGKRIHRGLYKSKQGKLLNSDVNGSYNIMRKYLNVSSNTLLSYELRALPFMPSVLNPLKTHNFNFLQVV